MNPKSKLELLANGRIENGKKMRCLCQKFCQLDGVRGAILGERNLFLIDVHHGLVWEFFGLVDQKTLHLLLHQFESRLGSFEVFDDGLDVFGRSASAVHILFFLFRLRVLLSHLEHGSLRLLAHLGDGLKKIA